MTTVQELEQAVFRTVAAHVPQSQLRRIQIEPYINSVDEEGLRVTVVMTDDRAALGGEAVIEIVLDVSDRLAEIGERRVPTVYFAGESDLVHSGDPDA